MARPKELLGNKIPIKNAYLQSAITWPSVLGGEMSLGVAGKHKGLKMYYTPQGLHLVNTDKDGKVLEALIPHANIQICVIDTSIKEDADE